jgi:hypothetical protein
MSHASNALSRLRTTGAPPAIKTRPSAAFPLFPAREQTAAPAHLRFPREHAKQQERERAAQPEHQHHHQRRLSEIAALRSQRRCGPQSWADAWAPHGAEHRTDAELPRQTAMRCVIELLLRPGA